MMYIHTGIHVQHNAPQSRVSHTQYKILVQASRDGSTYHVIDFVFVLKLACVFVASVVATSVVVLAKEDGINRLHETWQVVNPRSRARRSLAKVGSSSLPAN